MTKTYRVDIKKPFLNPFSYRCHDEQKHTRFFTCPTETMAYVENLKQNLEFTWHGSYWVSMPYIDSRDNRKTFVTVADEGTDVARQYGIGY